MASCKPRLKESTSIFAKTPNSSSTTWRRESDTAASISLFVSKKEKSTTESSEDGPSHTMESVKAWKSILSCSNSPSLKRRTRTRTSTSDISTISWASRNKQLWVPLVRKRRTKLSKKTNLSKKPSLMSGNTLTKNAKKCWRKFRGKITTNSSISSKIYPKTSNKTSSSSCKKWSLWSSTNWEIKGGVRSTMLSSTRRQTSLTNC